MEQIINMWVESWQDPAMRHAILVHFPIVIAVLLVPLSFAAMVWRGSGRTALVVLSLIACLLLIATAFFAKQAGGEAHDALGPAIAPQAAEAIGEHATAAVRIWWLGCISGGLLILSCIGKPGWRHTFRFVFFLASIALTGYVAFVADLGGRLVYKDGVGVPTGPAGAAAPHATTENASP